MDTPDQKEPRLVARRVPFRQTALRYLVATVCVATLLWFEFDYRGVDSWLHNSGWGWLVRTMNAIAGIVFLVFSWNSIRGREEKWWLWLGVSRFAIGVAFLVCAVIDRSLIVR